jgi:hypothetical protein
LSSEEREEKTELPVQVFQALEKRDEEQILAEMRGEILEDLVYDEMIQGRRVTNLSYAGVKEAIRRRGNLEILEYHVEETDKEIRALVKVRDHENRIDVLGASSAEREKPFAYTLAVNKAERNAFAKLIPAKWFATLIDEYLKRRRRGEPGHEPAEAAGPTPEPEQQPRVPITKETLAMPELRQFPLVEGLKAVGMLNVLDDAAEISIVPEGALSADDSAILGFLTRRVLEPLCAKHPEISFIVKRTEDGDLAYILVKGKLENGQIKELQSAARWAFSKAMERVEPEGQR